MPDPSLAALVKKAVDERTWRETHLLMSTPHDPEALEKAEAELEARIREIVREEVLAMFGGVPERHDRFSILPF